MNYLSNDTHIYGRNKGMETCTALKHHFQTNIYVGEFQSWLTL